MLCDGSTMKKHTRRSLREIDTRALAEVAGGAEPGGVEQSAVTPPVRRSRPVFRNEHFRMTNGTDLVESRYAAGKLVNVTGFPGGTLARDPYTGKFFSVPKR